MTYLNILLHPTLLLAINDESINYVIRLQEDKIKSYQKTEKKQKLSNAIQELELDVQGISNELPSKYKDLPKYTLTGDIQLIYSKL